MSEPLSEAVVSPRIRVWPRVLLAVALTVGAAAAAYAYFTVGRASREAVPPKIAAPPPSAPVRTAALARETLPLSGEYTGELDADVAEVGARTSGLLESVAVRIGDRVRAGQLLAVVDASEVRKQLAEIEASFGAARATRARASTQLEVATRTLARTEPLLADRLVSPQEVDELTSTVEARRAELEGAEAELAQGRARAEVLREQLKQARIVAPFAGRIAERRLDPGTVVAAGTPIVRIVADGPMRVRFRIPEHDLGRVVEGQPFVLTTRATGDREFRGTIGRLSAEVSAEDRSVAVEGTLDATHDVLRRGMFVRVRVTLGNLEDAPVVAGQAIVERLGPDGNLRKGLFVIDGDSARFVPAEVRGRSGDRVAIEADLADGARVIVEGQENLRDAAKVRDVGMAR